MNDEKTLHLNTIYNGNALDMLRKMPDDCIDCAVTSPPYLSLRLYDGSPNIWDGDEFCEHEWVEKITSAKYGTNSPENPSKIKAVMRQQESLGKPSKSAFCSKCGAWKGSLGLEPDANLYIKHLTDIFREVRRVLKPSGLFWLNIGDSYSGLQGNSRKQTMDKKNRSRGGEEGEESFSKEFRQKALIKERNLLAIPWRTALALKADGWILRMDNIWIKQSCMPSSVDGTRWEQHRIKICANCKKKFEKRPGEKVCMHCGGKSNVGRASENYSAHTGNQDHLKGSPNKFKSDVLWKECEGCEKCKPNNGLILRRGSWRPTNATEYIFMFSKTPFYYSDKYAVIHPYADSTPGRMLRGIGDNSKYTNPPELVDGANLVKPRLNVKKMPPIGGHKHSEGNDNPTQVGNTPEWDKGGANLRSWWVIRQTRTKFQHYACFPIGLPEICIKASVSQRGNCICGKPYARIIKSTVVSQKETPIDIIDRGWPIDESGKSIGCGNTKQVFSVSDTVTLGWKKTCKCETDEIKRPIVLDPFMGTGTTAFMANAIGCDWVGCELSSSYISFIRKRMGLFGNFVVVK